MKFADMKARNLVALATMALSTMTYAAGKHPGGKVHEAEETAIGKPGRATHVARIIKIEMSDSMRFTPNDIRVRQDETVRFVILNSGRVKHELNLGTERELQEHLELMKKFSGMEHDEPNKITLDPGKQGEIVWQFTKAGVVDFACLVPGHYEAGMKGKVLVVNK